MKTNHIWPGALALLLLAACPTADDPGPETGPPVYRVSVASPEGGTIRVKPESGPEGTEILVQAQAGENFLLVSGSLGYEDGAGFIPIDEELQRFTLPASDITVTARFLNGGELSRRMVTVPGKTVERRTGLSGQPFYNAAAVPVEVRSFKIGATEISYALWHTVRAWAESRAADAYTFARVTEGSAGQGAVAATPSERRYEPVCYVNWLTAVVWCNAYSEWDREVNGVPYEPVYKRGAEIIRNVDLYLYPEKPAWNAPGYRLPTEAEWEFAARGGDPDSSVWRNFRYAGGNKPDEVAWYKANSGGKTQTVGLKTPNTLGLYDISGNGWELYQERGVRGGAYDTEDPLITSRLAGSYTGTFRVVAPAN
jgi:formylglycine-generating enzyme required for sulfatase activity